MKRCLCCRERFIEKTSWRKLLFIESSSHLCERCESKIVIIKGRRCTMCSRALNSEKKRECCHDCIRWQKNEKTRDLLERNISLFQYNDFLKEWLSLYKFRGDAVAAVYFSEKIAAVYEMQFTNYIPVEVPLSAERLKARGFNQSVLLMQGWAEETAILRRIAGEKQSKRNRRERIAQVMNEPFSVNKEKAQLISGKKIVLIDDIYTTGTTVRQAARVLKGNGAISVASLTVAR